MLTKEDAIKLLRTNTEIIDHDELLRVYLKMMRRYPPEVFPEKAMQIREAYQVLAAGDDFWKEFIEGDELRLDFLIPYIADTSQDFSDKSVFDLSLPSAEYLRKRHQSVPINAGSAGEDVFSAEFSRYLHSLLC
ncbi:MAG: hypothetical protein HQK53_16795 [Oligoflexia bacterium]|nr:hypothetical protein [Oligoflexia bacterium]